MEQCKECQKQFETERSLHAHLKAHKMGVPEYYFKHFKRFDKYSNELIEFKDKESYFETDFASVQNMKNWFSSVAPETAREYAKNLLVARKEKKNLIYAPTQVELRSLQQPTLITYQKLFKNYYDLASGLGFKNKHRFPDSFSLTGTGESYANIIIDTREQTPLLFKNLPVEVGTLNFGDYGFSNLEHCGNVYIERKSLVDFVGTMSGGYERFCREIQRAKDANAYLMIIVEDTLERALNFNKLGILPDKAKATESYIFHHVRGICQTFENCQFLFIKDREEAALKIESIFMMGAEIKEYDLQYLVDIGKF